MGHPRRLKKKYSKPKNPWERDRITAEKDLIKEYGLKNKKEIWRAGAILRKYSGLARKLVGETVERRRLKEEALVQRLVKRGFLKEGNTLDDILSLNVRDILERRLQTIVWKKGIGLSAKQARQFITHGHIKVKGSKTTSPSMFIDIETEKTIGWFKKPIETIKTKEMESKESREISAKKKVETESVKKVIIEKDPLKEKPVVEKKLKPIEKKKEETPKEENKPEPEKKVEEPKKESVTQAQERVLKEIKKEQPVEEKKEEVKKDG